MQWLLRLPMFCDPLTRAGAKRAELASLRTTALFTLLARDGCPAKHLKVSASTAYHRRGESHQHNSFRD